MKFFIDTANLDEIREAQAMGVLDGVTTNPSLMAQEEGEFEDIIRAICEMVDGPVSAEVVSTDTEGMIAEARHNAAIHEQVVVKIPITPDGLKAIKACSDEGIRVNVTLCFSATQALMAAKAGATYISPFIGRLDDLGQDGMELIRTVRQIYDHYGFCNASARREFAVAQTRRRMRPRRRGCGDASARRVGQVARASPNRHRLGTLPQRLARMASREIRKIGFTSRSSATYRRCFRCTQTTPLSERRCPKLCSLMRNKKIVDFFDTARDAVTPGEHF